MVVVLVDLNKPAIAQACKLLGGVKAVSLKASVNNSNIGKWLKGSKTLSNVSVLRVLDAIGLPKGQADTKRVHEWSFRVQMPGFEKGVSLFFPNGAELMRAPWSRWGIKALVRQFTLSGLGFGDNPPEVFALTDGNVRVVIRRTDGYPMVPRDFGKNFSWRGGDIDKAVLNFGGDKNEWLEGGITLKKFDNAWGEGEATWGDVLEYANREKYNATEVLDCLHKNLRK